MPDEATPNQPRYPGDPAAGGDIKPGYVDPNKSKINAGDLGALAAAEAEKKRKAAEGDKKKTPSAVQREALKQ